MVAATLSIQPIGILICIRIGENLRQDIEEAEQLRHRTSSTAEGLLTIELNRAASDEPADGSRKVLRVLVYCTAIPK